MQFARYTFCERLSCLYLSFLRTADLGMENEGPNGGVRSSNRIVFSFVRLPERLNHMLQEGLSLFLCFESLKILALTIVMVWVYAATLAEDAQNRQTLSAEEDISCVMLQWLGGLSN